MNSRRTGVVVDHEDERALVFSHRGLTGRGRLEVTPPVAPVAAGRVERRDAALVGPLADGRLGDAEELRGLAERQPVRLAVGARLAGEVTPNVAKLPIPKHVYGFLT